MKATLFTVSYAGFWGQAKLSLPDTLRKAKQLGYPAVEIMGKRPHLSMVDHSDEDVRALKKLVQDLGLDVATIASYTNFTGGLESSEVPFVEIQLGYIKRLAEMGEILGAKILRVFTGYFTDALSWDAQWSRCVDAVRQASDICAAHGLILGVQNHHDIAVGVDSYVEFLDDVNKPNCKAMFDAWSVALQGVTDLYGWGKKLGSRTVQTTIADYVKLPRFRHAGGLVNYEVATPATRAVAVGDGFIDYASFIRGLRDGGFDGYLSYEMCSALRGGGGIENLDKTAKRSLDAINKLIAG